LARDRAPSGLGTAISGTEWRRLRAFFEAREYRPAWTSGDRPSSLFHDAVAAIEQADDDALVPEHYDVVWLRAERDRFGGFLSRASLDGDQAIVRLELRTTAAVLR